MEEMYHSPLFRGIDKHILESLLDGKCRVRDFSRGEIVPSRIKRTNRSLLWKKGLYVPK